MKNLFIILVCILSSTTTFAQTEIALNDYGTYHNNLLTEFYKKNNFKTESLNSAIDKVTIIAANLYPAQFKNFNNSNLKLSLKSYSPSTLDVGIIWDLKKSELLSKKISSEKLVALIDNIISTNNTYAIKIEQIESFKKSNALTENDLKILSIFQSVYSASHTYWTTNNSTAPLGKWHITDRELADALGALIWFETGPGSIVAGAICSGFF